MNTMSRVLLVVTLLLAGFALLAQAGPLTPPAGPVAAGGGVAGQEAPGPTRLLSRAIVPAVDRLLGDRLQAVREEIRRLIQADFPLIADVNAHLLQMQGKMFRPMALTVVAALVVATAASRS